ncbi:MAG: acyl-CoA thioesterase II [Myxococcales bacterium]|nr:acyl-CoA thioesterase II [Myxococcales bacterium]
MKHDENTETPSTGTRNKTLDELLDLLKLERIEETIFRGKSQDLGFGAIFGGQVLGQALSAASQTVVAERRVHSLHGYFLRPGDPARPIVYDVDCIRDGTSFTTRRVVAIQKGRAIFSMSASFQVDEEGFEHQAEMPGIEGPEKLLSVSERTRRVQHRIPEPIRGKLTADRPIEIRPVNPIDPFAPEKRPPVRYNWIRAIDRLPDDPAVHHYLLAYASDFGLVAASLYPHGHTYWDPQMQVASLDHAMWFHRDFRIDDWLLHAIESPSASRARGLSHGRIFTRDGRLVCVTAQEGLIRKRGATSR